MLRHLQRSLKVLPQLENKEQKNGYIKNVRPTRDPSRSVFKFELKTRHSFAFALHMRFFFFFIKMLCESIIFWMISGLTYTNKCKSKCTLVPDWLLSPFSCDCFAAASACRKQVQE